MYHRYYNNSYVKCLLPINIVRQEIYQDEGSETTPEIFHCDKCKGHIVSVSEKSTFVANQVLSKYSNLTLRLHQSMFYLLCYRTNEFNEKYKRKDKERVKLIENKETDGHKVSIYK